MDLCLGDPFVEKEDPKYSPKAFHRKTPPVRGIRPVPQSILRTTKVSENFSDPYFERKDHSDKYEMKKLSISTNTFD